MYFNSTYIPFNMESEKPIHTLVLDTGSIIKNEPSVSTLLNQSEILITVPEILTEIKDAATRSRVETTLRPFLTLRSPNPNSVKFVTDFARRTGDLAVLSRPDILIIALTYELECERNGGDWRLRRAPGQKRINGSPPQKDAVEVKDVGGKTAGTDGLEKKTDDLEEPSPARESASTSIAQETPSVARETASTVPETSSDSLQATDPVQPENSSDVPTNTEQDSAPSETDARPMDDLSVALDDTTISSEQTPPQEDPTPPTDAAQDSITTTPSHPPPQDSPPSKIDSAHNSSSPQESSDSDSEGWITPSNLRKKQAEDSGASTAQTATPKTMQAAVLTTDYAMQNVLLQINLNLLSPSLTRISHLKTFILRCHSCFQTTKDMTKQFCPRCGQPTLTRVSCSTNANGEFKLHLKRNMQWNHRGDRYSIPKPVHGSSNGRVQGGGKGGWGNGLMLAEDQKEYQRATTVEKKAKARDLMDEDYLPSILTGDRRREGGRIKVGAGRGVNGKKR